MYTRLLNISKLLEKKSILLFGARQTGKSTLVRQTLSEFPVFDLLDSDIYQALLKRPKVLSEWIKADQNLVVIDEIQKIPALLDEVHRLIESKKIKFLLTGSSVRKLRHGGSNLLAGRAWQRVLLPLTYCEIPEFDHLRYLNQGGLPAFYDSKFPRDELSQYVATYLKDEIQAEAAVRNLQPFSMFLDLMGHANGQELNKQSISEDAGVSPKTIDAYLQILEDTFIAYQLPAFTLSKKRRPILRSKFFYVDVGVANFLAKRGMMSEGSVEYGHAFEHWMINEVRAYNAYSERNVTLAYWRTASDFEVDLIIDNSIGIEFKSTRQIQAKHLKGLRALQEEGMVKKLVAVSHDMLCRQTEDGIHILPWQEFLQELWQGKIF